MTSLDSTSSRRGSKYQRARLRNFLFTVGPDRVSGGRLSRRHLGQGVELRDIEITTPAWGHDHLRIAHVSDLHVGPILPPDAAVEVIEQLRDVDHDIVACTGDVVDLHADGCEPVFEALANTGAPLGCLMVLGNHDELDCGRTVTRMAEAAGVHVLHDESVQIVRNGAHVTIAGAAWSKSAVELASRVDRACGDGADLLLAHNPKAFLRAVDLGVPLTLSGHTHGGQLALPKRPRASLAVVHRHRAGLYESGDSRLYVTTGVGAWFPLRVNCPAEVALIDVRPDET